MGLKRSENDRPEAGPGFLPNAEPPVAADPWAQKTAWAGPLPQPTPDWIFLAFTQGPDSVGHYEPYSFMSPTISTGRVPPSVSHRRAVAAECDS